MLSRLRAMRAKHGLRGGLRREFWLWRNRYLFPTTIASIRRAFDQLGIGRGDLVMVHSAFSRIGYVRGGTAAFMTALRETVGPEGTVMMPSFPFNAPAAEYARRAVVFDVRNTPSRVGRLQEDFRLSAGTLRSVHPTHPYCAQGPLASELVAGHYLQPNPFGPKTPSYRFVEGRGKCILIGVGLKNCSPFRVIEDSAFPYPVFEPNLFDFQVVDDSGQTLEVKTLVHSAALAPQRRNEVFRGPLVAHGKLVEGRLGLTRSTVVDCDGLLPLMRNMLAQGKTPYSHLTSGLP